MKRKEYKEEYDVFETPDNLWSNIETKLDEPKKKLGAILWLTSGGVAAALLVTMMILKQQKNYEPLVNIGEEDKSLADASDSIHDYDRVVKDNSVETESSQKNQPLTTTNQQQQTATNGSYTGVVYNGSSLGKNITLSGGYGGANKGLLKVENLNIVFASRRGQSSDLKKKDLSYIWDLDEEPVHGSTYDAIIENGFISTTEEVQSTFSIDVDGASYSDVRGMIRRGVLPDPNAVRMEELINYFPYNYDEPKGDDPFAFHTEVINCPWNSKHQLMKIGIKGESIDKEALPPNNLVFLLDVSGSMTSPYKLGLIKKGFNLLVQEMREEDRVAICVYAGAAGLVLEPTSGANKDKIMDAINRLEAGGSTAGGQGIELAYATAQKHFNPNGNNRVILATDGDFNVGISDDNSLVKLIERKRESGVALTVLGVGHDNFQSSKMEKLANNGNGNFSYIDNILEAKKVLVTEMGATLKTIAKDVKIQVDFNPETVQSYRLIGYENRLLANEDFDNDAVDAGELGAGHTVTAVYEIVPTGEESSQDGVSGPLKSLQEIFLPNVEFAKNELAVLKFRYKEPLGSKSKLITTRISDGQSGMSNDMHFISAVIEFGLLLRDSQYQGSANFERVLKNARLGLGRDPYGYRSEFIQLVQHAQRLRNAD